MPGFIKNAADERMWEKAKDRARAAATKGGVYNVWGLANSIFHKMKSGEMINEEDAAITPDLENGRGLINNILEDECYRDIKHYVFNHPVYGNLSEEELYNSVEECYDQYLNKNKDLSTGLIYEFVNQYFNGSGITSAGYVAGGGVVGGYRAEKPIGPIVYGMPDSGLTPGEGMVNNRPKPAVVEIPDHKSNYKPWEFDLDNNGNVVSDIERNKTIANDQDKQKIWNNVSHEVAFELERAGVDLDDLEHMTQEEIEDTLLKVIKQQSAQQKQQGAQQAVSQAKGTAEKIQEAFAWEAMSEDRVDGKTRRAREILAKKHQIKKALERDASKRFVMDKRAIEKTMFKYGYIFNKDGWMKRQPKAGKFQAVGTPPAPAEAPEPDSVVQQAAPMTIIQRAVAPQQKLVNKVKPQDDSYDDDEDDETSDPNPLHDPLFRDEMKYLQARFILGMGHDDKDATVFVANPQTNEDVPKVSNEDIDKKLTLQGYTWNPDKLMWFNNSMTLPHQLFAKKETPKTVWARSYLAARGKLNTIKINETGDASVSIEDILEDMADDNFVFDAETNSWKWVEPKEELKESVEVPNFINVEEDDVLDEANNKNNQEDNEPKLDYDPHIAGRLQARFLLRAEYLNQYKTWLKKKSRPKLAIENAWAKVQDPNNNPVDFDNNKIVKPTMDDAHVIRDLKNLGYSATGKNGIVMWSKGGSLPPYIGEDQQSLLARSILGAIYKKSDFLSFDDSIAKNGTVRPALDAKQIKDDIQHLKYEWDDEYGWTKSKAGVAEQLSPEQRKYAKQMRDVVKQFEFADWDGMSSQQRNAFERALAYPKMLSFFGIKPNDFPVADTPEDKDKREELFRKFKKKWKFELRDGQKVWALRKKPVDQELHSNKFKAAVSWVAKKLGQGTALAGGSLLQGLIDLNKAFDPGINKAQVFGQNNQEQK